MILDYYEKLLKELEELKINIDDLSNNQIRHKIGSIVDCGWSQIETLLEDRQNKKYSKEEIQKHFNEMLKVVPMSRVRDET